MATTAAALRYVKSKGAPSSLLQVHSERAAKNSKPHNGFEYLFQAPNGTAVAKPPSKPASTMHVPHTVGRPLHSSAEFIVLFELPRSVMLGPTTCSHCGRGSMSNASLSWWPDGLRRVRGLTLGVLHVHVGWGAKPLGDTNTQECM